MIYKEEIDSKTFELPRGVLLVTDKITGEEWTEEDAANLESFGHILIRFYDMVNVIETFYGLRKVFIELLSTSSDVESGLV